MLSLRRSLREEPAFSFFASIGSGLTFFEESIEETMKIGDLCPERSEW
jgi:hypothetical protein